MSEVSPAFSQRQRLGIIPSIFILDIIITSPLGFGNYALIGESMLTPSEPAEREVLHVEGLTVSVSHDTEAGKSPTFGSTFYQYLPLHEGVGNWDN